MEFHRDQKKEAMSFASDFTCGNLQLSAVTAAQQALLAVVLRGFVTKLSIKP